MLKRLAFFFIIMLFTHAALSSQNTSKESSSLIGTKFPKISSETLARTEIILPEEAQDKIALITIAFKHGTQQQLDTWLNPFLEAFGTKPGFVFYEIPMLSSVVKLFAFRIDGGMRAGIPEEKHKNVMTFYGNYTKYTRQLHIDDLTLGYAFLLDREGIIRWHGEGFATEDMIREMIDSARRLEQKR